MGNTGKTESYKSAKDKITGQRFGDSFVNYSDFEDAEELSAL